MRFTRAMPPKIFAFLALILLLSACAHSKPASPADMAAAQATQIVDQARATALIQNARATADALLASPTPPAATPIPAIALAPADLHQEAPAIVQPTPTQEISQTVKLLGLSFGADNSLLSVQFLAPVAVVRHWKEGNMYLIDEVSGEKYAEIPIMPVIGALFAHPTSDGQPGYVMFTNLPVPLKTGAIVTVVLGNYRWEHVTFPMQNP